MMNGNCWADPLSRAERRELARKLARACQRFYNTPAGGPRATYSQVVASAEMSDLHLDVTERATGIIQLISMLTLIAACLILKGQATTREKIMSVTFTTGRYVEDPRFGTVLEHGRMHEHKCTEPEPCEDAQLYFGYCDHADTAREACGCTALDVNVSNANAVLLLDRLGLPSDPEDLTGSADPEDFMGRALTGNIGQDDSGDRDAVDGGPGTGRALMVDCGHRAGYFGDRLAALSELARAAKSQGELVVWS